MGEQSLAEKILSWTFDLKIAKDFKKGVPAKGNGMQGVIFERQPKQDEIVVNLWSLFRNQDFLAAIQEHKNSITDYKRGMSKYSDAQCEIILKVESLAQEHVYSLGGHTSPPEEILDQATAELYGTSPTTEQREWLRWGMNVGPIVTGPKWLSRNATRSVLSKVEPKTPPLRTKKAAQRRASETEVKPRDMHDPP
ncbi:hypothetical protein [Pseudomonas sp. MH10]|uniref:hypothetical protein n=1 Tax=Pseudomonas sp. MH10 TaxID=3048627 RepID=UPI002AC8ECF4|nr:hypothetical protein [Pseudomonas sp. MH10]MEB0042646.1 hypothetical protein [Pseudomonas sp. MH10]WPX63530.1 hypothetical protein RHM59_22035 [Pseudomonas sp. MH10]